MNDKAPNTRQFVLKCAEYKLKQFYPNLELPVIRSVAKVMHNNMKRNSGCDFVTEMAKYGIDAIKDSKQLEQCQEDIGCAIVGLGIDMDETPPSALHWTC